MEKVRIGNDIEVKYTVLRDGLQESFAGATNIVVEVKNEAYGKVIPSTFSIVGNIVNIMLDAADCVLCGKHRVTLSYNRGNDITIDELAFELVQFTSQTGGTEIVGVEIVTVNISGDIGIAIPDNNKIDLDGLNSNIDKLHFKPDTLVQLAEVGDVRFSPESKTLEVKVSDTVSLQLGQEMQTRVKNDAGVQINNGQLVYIDSAAGANPLAKIASTTDADIAQRTFGMATENIANNGFGAITTEGLVRDINTSAFAEGDMLWLGTNGSVTNIEPVAPTPKISVGMVLRSNINNGVIYVKIRAIARNQKLSDVYAPTLTGGDILRWNSTTLRFETFNVTTALAGKADLVGGKIPTSQLPAYVDDVLEYANLAAFPVTGETGKIYVALDTNLTYRWSGSAYVEISKSLALGETSSTAYRGDRGMTAYDHSQLTGNAHSTTAAQIPNTPVGTIAATTVQGAINELDSDVVQVRADLNEIETDLNLLNDKLNIITTDESKIYEYGKSIYFYTNKAIKENGGGLSTAVGVTTYYFYAPSDGIIQVNVGSATWMRMNTGVGTPESLIIANYGQLGNVVKPLPTNTTWNVTAGDVVVYSVLTPIIDMIVAYTTVTIKHTIIGASVKDKNGFLKWNGSYFEFFSKRNEKQYISFIVKNYVNNSDTAYQNVWSWRESNLYDYYGGDTVFYVCDLMNKGAESEFTMLIQGKSDHTGGYHGDERIDIDGRCYVKFFADGKLITDSDMVSAFVIECNEFSYVEYSTLHESSNTPGGFVVGHPIIAYHLKENRFKNCISNINNHVKFVSDQNLIKYYSAMAAINKNSATYAVMAGNIDQMDGSTYISSHGTLTPELIGTGNFFNCENTIANSMLFFNPIKGLKSHVFGKMLQGIDDTNMDVSQIWDRGVGDNDSKWYRSTATVRAITVNSIIANEQKIEFE